MESVAAFAWNGWQASSGISGNLGLEYAQRDGANQVEKQCPGKLLRRGLAAEEVAKGQRTQETTDDDRRAQYRAAYERDGLSYRDHLNTATGETF